MTEGEFIQLYETLAPDIIRAAQKRRHCSKSAAEDALQTVVCRLLEDPKRLAKAGRTAITKYLLERTDDQVRNNYRSEKARRVREVKWFKSL